MGGFFRDPVRLFTGGAAGLLAGAALLYGSYALLAGTGLIEASRPRALPAIFVVHALGGGAALILGVAQVLTAGRQRLRLVHRLSGRLYVAGVCAAALSGIVSALAFQVGPWARASFLSLGVLWIVTTLAGLVAIRAGRVPQHRAWMIRSYALALFFVSFTFWVPLLAGGLRTAEPWYTLAVTLSWVVNLVLAELVIRGVPSRVQSVEA